MNNPRLNPDIDIIQKINTEDFDRVFLEEDPISQIQNIIHEVVQMHDVIRNLLLLRIYRGSKSYIYDEVKRCDSSQHTDQINILLEENNLCNLSDLEETCIRSNQTYEAISTQKKQNSKQEKEFGVVKLTVPLTGPVPFDM